jgi:hypothetical protein
MKNISTIVLIRNVIERIDWIMKEYDINNPLVKDYYQRNIRDLIVSNPEIEMEAVSEYCKYYPGFKEAFLLSVAFEFDQFSLFGIDIEQDLGKELTFGTTEEQAIYDKELNDCYTAYCNDPNIIEEGKYRELERKLKFAEDLGCRVDILDSEHEFEIFIRNL